MSKRWGTLRRTTTSYTARRDTDPMGKVMGWPLPPQDATNEPAIDDPATRQPGNPTLTTFASTPASTNQDLYTFRWRLRTRPSDNRHRPVPKTNALTNASSIFAALPRFAGSCNKCDDKTITVRWDQRSKR